MGGVVGAVITVTTILAFLYYKIYVMKAKENRSLSTEVTDMVFHFCLFSDEPMIPKDEEQILGGRTNSMGARNVNSRDDE